MIKNLNKHNFFPYGRIIGERLTKDGFPTGPQWETKLERISGKPDAMYMSEDTCVYMDFERGMSILLVALPTDPENPVAFYLDKSICINRGVYYCVFPFDQGCDAYVYICMSRNVQIWHVPLPAQSTVSVISSSMEIQRICTLFYQEKDSGFFFKGESHPQYELTYMDKGSMHSIVGGQDYLLSQGEMMLYGSDQWHAQYTEGSESVCFLTITFDMDCRYADALLNKKLPVDASGAALLNRILTEFRGSDFLSGDLICCHLMEFLLNMIRHVHRGDRGQPLQYPHTANNENQIVDRALRYIADNIYEKLSVAGVASAVNVCSSYLSVLFSRHLKTKPSEYIRREKLEESKLLIRQGELNFTQIADRLKFSSVYHFSYQFKRWYGMTPSEFARSIVPSNTVQDRLKKQESKEQE